MARKPKMQSRSQNAPRASQTQRSRGSKQLFCQCGGCGAVVDPIFGADEANSWCPYCKQPGLNECREGQLPDPERYGAWLERNGKAEDVVVHSTVQAITESSLQPNRGSITMKQTTYHTGKYSCLDCCIEYEVFHDEQLQCDRCKGRLVKGSLDEFEDDRDDSDEDQ